MIDVRWAWIVLDTVDGDAEVAEAFWSDVTRAVGTRRSGSREEFAALEPERGDAWVLLQRETEPSGHGAHLDLVVAGSVADAAADAERLGARMLSRSDDLVVLASPAGAAFCLLPLSEGDETSEQVREGQPDLLDQVCLDIPAGEYAREVDFWESLTGWPKRPGSLPEFVSLTRPDGIPVRLLLQRLGEEAGTARAHVDFACHDRDASRTTHVAAGASVVSEHDFWTVMRDPVGRVYCLTHRKP